jgi:hypothetical protein
MDKNLILHKKELMLSDKSKNNFGFGDWRRFLSAKNALNRNCSEVAALRLSSYKTKYN